MDNKNFTNNIFLNNVKKEKLNLMYGKGSLVLWNIKQIKYVVEQYFDR